jgi:type IV pilus assembly protein PilV
MRSYQKHKHDMEKGTRSLKKENGFTLLEVIVSIAILTFGLLAVASMQVTAIRGNDFASRISEASAWGQEKVEELSGLSYTDADLDPNGNPHAEQNPPAGYAITWNVDEDPDLDGDGSTDIPNVKLITVTVTWQDKGYTKRAQLTCIKPEL